MANNAQDRGWLVENEARRGENAGKSRDLYVVLRSTSKLAPAGAALPGPTRL
ncbi:hypothetical protein [Citrobacter sp. R56]|uniref:hypothetical protein n=1 Tax=Citrobacter sp. R56 TaxID=1573676 RepID=UPI001EEE4958|nr:hypothetical protein [Citrobacter sp. R56]